jgi:peptidyl-prolyl cis-trans isomerase D
MLDLMRRHAKSWFIKVLLGGIVVTFISWGGYSRYSARSNTVAYINGKPLMIQDYERAYSQSLDRFRAQGVDMDEETTKRLREQIYNDLVKQMLMLQEAERLGLLRVSKEELRERITRFPAFQVEGRFDEKQYRRVLAGYNMTPAQFEEQLRTETVLEKLRRLVTGFAKVSEAEAFEDWRYRNEKVTVDYASLASADFLGQVKIGDKDMSAYYEARKDSYRKPARVKIGYVVFDRAMLAKEAAPSEEQVRQEYEQFQEDYLTPHEVKARHILLRVPQGASKEAERKTEQKALAILAEAKSGADFSELAKKYSQDPGSASKGGDLGWFGEGQMVEPFEEAAFALSKGSLGGPVRTQFGYHLIKVDDVHEPRQRPFEEVRGEIAEMLARDKAEDLADSRLAESYGKVAKAGSLRKYAEEAGLKYQETGFLAQGEPVPGLADSGRVLSKAFEKKVGEFDSDPERELGPVLFEVVERSESYVPPLEEVAPAVRKKMTEEKAQELSSTAAMKVIKAARSGASLKAAAAKQGGKAGRVGPFLRTAVPPELGYNAAMAAFSLSADQPLADVPYSTPKGWVAIRLVERQEPSREEFEAHKGEATQRLLSLKRQGIFETWLKRLGEKADIEVVNKVS